jgi:hypothetical protein
MNHAGRVMEKCVVAVTYGIEKALAKRKKYIR